MRAPNNTLSTVSSAIHRANFRINCLISLIILGMIIAISFYLKYVEIDYEDLVLLWYLIIACVEMNIVLHFISDLHRQPR